MSLSGSFSTFQKSTCEAGSGFTDVPHRIARERVPTTCEAGSGFTDVPHRIARERVPTTCEAGSGFTASRCRALFRNSLMSEVAGDLFSSWAASRQTRTSN